MISLNLNSPYQKREIKLDRLYHLLKNSLGLISIILILSSIILTLAKNTLQENFNSIIAETSLVQLQIRGSNQRIANINKQLSELNEIQDNFVPWSNILVYLNKNIPPNIKINFFVINPVDIKKTDRWTIAIKGMAKTRDDFLAFQDKLKKLSFFDKIEIPIDNITQRENIEFEFKVIMSTNKIKSSQP